jgi:hypothetical protein
LDTELCDKAADNTDIAEDSDNADDAASEGEEVIISTSGTLI